MIVIVVVPILMGCSGGFVHHDERMGGDRIENRLDI